MISQKELKKRLHYNKDTGIFKWIEHSKNSPFKEIKQVAGTVNKYNYQFTICINQVRYVASHLAWLYEYGYLPKYRIETKNKIRTDIRIDNLFINYKRPLKKPKVFKEHITTMQALRMIKKEP